MTMAIIVFSVNRHELTYAAVSQSFGIFTGADAAVIEELLGVEDLDELSIDVLLTAVSVNLPAGAADHVYPAWVFTGP